MEARRKGVESFQQLVRGVHPVRIQEGFLAFRIVVVNQHYPPFAPCHRIEGFGQLLRGALPPLPLLGHGTWKREVSNEANMQLSPWRVVGVGVVGVVGLGVGAWWRCRAWAWVLGVAKLCKVRMCGFELKSWEK